MGDTLVQKIAERNPTVADLLDFEKEFRSAPLMMRQYVMAQRANIDYVANVEAEREEGREEERKTIVRTIREDGTMTDEQIATLLKLPLEFVESV